MKDIYEAAVAPLTNLFKFLCASIGHNPTMTPPFNFAKWQDDCSYNWSDSQAGISVPFYSPKSFDSSFCRFSISTPKVPISSVNQSGRNIHVVSGTNFERRDSRKFRRRDSFAVPLCELSDNVPLPRGPTCTSFGMEQHKVESFENSFSPPLRRPTPAMARRFENLSPIPRGNSMRQSPCPPCRDDSGLPSLVPKDSLSSVNQSSGTNMASQGTKSDPHDSKRFHQSDNFLVPLREWNDNVPLPQCPRSFGMNQHPVESRENYLSPRPFTPVKERPFQDFPPVSCSSSMQQLPRSPLSDDSGYSDHSRSSELSGSPIQFMPEMELPRPEVRRMKRKADDDFIPPLFQSIPKRKRVDGVNCLQRNDWMRLDIPAPPALPCSRANPLVNSLPPCIQSDLDVIFQSIVEVFLIKNDVNGVSFNRDSFIAEMKATSASYSRNNLAFSEIRQDFTKWQTRWGYMYMYLMRHAHLVFHTLKQIHLTSESFLPIANNNWDVPFDQGGLHSRVFLQKCHQPRILTVCSVGGGPGSDLIGLALFLRANRSPVKIRAHVFDKCMDWEKSWKDLFGQLPLQISEYFESVTFSHFDYLSGTITNTQAEIVRKADLVTIVKSLSAVATKLSKPKSVNRDSNGLFEILSMVSSGCVVLYLDNKAGTPGKVLQQTVKRIPGYQYTMMYYEISQVQLPSGGFSFSSRRFMDWVSYGPSFSSGTNEIVVLARRWMMNF